MLRIGVDLKLLHSPATRWSATGFSKLTRKSHRSCRALVADVSLLFYDMLLRSVKLAISSEIVSPGPGPRPPHPIIVCRG